MPSQTLSPTVRWNLTVSRDTDRRLRAHLRHQGIDKGGLSKFIEEAVRWQVLDDVVREVKTQNTHRDPAAIQQLIDDSLAEVRAERRSRRRG